ncbi:MAG: DUF4834 family protein [Cyclobacteriaceae bacterium]
MLKFLLILFLIGYIFFKVSGFLFKTLFFKAYQQQQAQRAAGQGAQTSGYARKPADGNVQIDHVPQSSPKAKSKSEFDGGDYVDYEEVD